MDFTSQAKSLNVRIVMRFLAMSLNSSLVFLSTAMDIFALSSERILLKEIWTKTDQ